MLQKAGNELIPFLTFIFVSNRYFRDFAKNQGPYSIDSQVFFTFKPFKHLIFAFRLTCSDLFPSLIYLNYLFCFILYILYSVYSFWHLVPSGRASTSLLACSSPFPLYTSLILFVHLTSGLPLLRTFNFHTLSSQTLHSFFSQDDQTTSKYLFSPIPLHTLHSTWTSSHATSFIHIFIALTIPSCHTTISSQIN